MSFTLVPTTTLTFGGISGNSATSDLLVTADLNGDGQADLVMEAYNSSNYELFSALGTSSGFAPPITTALSTSYNTIAVGDVNGDGKADLLLGNSYTTTLTILDGQGNGGFTAGPTLTVPAGYSTYAVADLNNDGRADIITAAESGFGGSILLANAVGGFAAATTYTLATALTASISLGSSSFPSIAAGDLNGDGKTDIVASGSNGVSVGWGTGSGFTAGPVLADPANAGIGGMVIIADVNKDGHPDIVQGTAGGVVVFLSNGSGGFFAGQFYAVSALTSGPISFTPTSLAVADVTGDGINDIVVTSSGNNVTAVLVGQIGGGFVAISNTLTSADVLAGTNAVGAREIISPIVAYTASITVEADVSTIATASTAAAAASAWLASGTAMGEVAVSDTTANITFYLANLVPIANAGLLASTNITDTTGYISLTAAQVASSLPVLAHTTEAGGTALGMIITGSMTAAQAAATFAALSTGSYTVTVSDSAANILANLAALNSATLTSITMPTSRLAGITLTDATTPAITVTPTQLTSYSGVLTRITSSAYILAVSGTLAAAQAVAVPSALLSHLTTGLPVADSAANVGGTIPGLQTIAAAGKLASVTLTDGATPSVPISSSVLTTGLLALGAITGSYTLAVTGTLTAAQMAAVPAAIAAHIVPGLTVVDSAANVAASLPGLSIANAGIGAITLTDGGTPAIALTAAEFAGAAALAKISTGFTVSVTGSVSATAASAYPSAKFSALTTSLAVQDSAATVSANLNALQAIATAGKLAGITLTGSTTLSISLAQLTSDAGALALTSLYSLAVSGVSVSALASTLATAHVVSVAVSDSAANVAANLATLEADALSGKLTAITLVDGGTPTLSVAGASLSADFDALALLSGSYAIALTGGGAPTVTVAASKLPVAATALAAITGSWQLAITGTPTAAQAVVLSAAVAAHLTAALPVSDTAANNAASLAGLQVLESVSPALNLIWDSPTRG